MPVRFNSGIDLGPHRVIGRAVAAAPSLDHDQTPGGLDLYANTWAHDRGDEQRFTTWVDYAQTIKRLFGASLRAMNPDGTWREWDPLELET